MRVKPKSNHITNDSIPFFLRAPGVEGGSDLYALFSARGNPGSNRSDCNTARQPIRNGDGGYLALSLLRLPPIPGSFIVPALVAPSVTLSIARLDGQGVVFWTDPSGEYSLETIETLPAAPNVWQAVTSGITTNDRTRVLTITNAVEFPARYFRLRKPGS